jgi:hypothetical protein
MARINPKALTIVVTDIDMIESLASFSAKGHTITYMDMTKYECDVIIGPRCWRVDPRMRLGDDSTEEESLERQLEMMEKGVRAIKFPKEMKDAK